MRLDDYRTIQRLVGAGLTVALVPASALDADAPVHVGVSRDDAAP